MWGGGGPAAVTGLRSQRPGGTAGANLSDGNRIPHFSMMAPRGQLCDPITNSIRQRGRQRGLGLGGGGAGGVINPAKDASSLLKSEKWLLAARWYVRTLAHSLARSFCLVAPFVSANKPVCSLSPLISSVRDEDTVKKTAS